MPQDDSKLPPNLRRRYGRQIRLSEIGEAGQGKLCEAETLLGGSGFARTIEERYVRAAGMRVVEGEAAVAGPTAPDVSTLGLRNEAARDVAEGALRALGAVRKALAFVDDLDVEEAP